MFISILFEKAEDAPEKVELEASDFFADLNLDQIVDAITAGKEEYNLKTFFYTSLRKIDAIQYRQEIMRDLESKSLLENVRSFAQQMRSMREHLAQARKLHYRYQKQSWFLDAVQIYCDTIDCLVRDLSFSELKSTGLATFRDHLINYAESGRFKTLLAETKKLKIDLAAVKYCILIKGSGIKVRNYDSEVDYSETVEATFQKFKQGAVKNYEVKFPDRSDMNHIEEKILDFVARLYPDLFLELTNYCANNGDYLDPSISAFDREIQFYVSYLDYISRFKHGGLKFCYPRLLDQDKEVFSYEGFDLALAQKLLADQAPLVCNDFYLKDKERIFVVTGPNQGGKTTFARTFGQLHHLASIGCAVPGRQSQLFLFDRIFTHFEKEENIRNRRGKLEDDLVRVHDILRQMTSRSIIIMNESLTSTTLKDAIFLSKMILGELLRLDLLCVCVTFIDELASLSEKTVSMVSTVIPENPAARTFKIVRRGADGLSYAISIAEKYRVTYKSLKERIQS